MVPFGVFALVDYKANASAATIGYMSWHVSCEEGHRHHEEEPT
jgi:hypothetical protein